MQPLTPHHPKGRTMETSNLIILSAVVLELAESFRIVDGRLPRITSVRVTRRPVFDASATTLEDAMWEADVDSTFEAMSVR